MDVKPIAWRVGDHLFDDSRSATKWSKMFGYGKEPKSLYDQKAIDMLRDDLEVLENMRDVLRESPEETFREDAARYRWMASCKCCPFSEADSAWESKDALDTAIDAAREVRDAPSR